jgi:hypothetical protein
MAERPYTTVPVLYEDRQAYEVIQVNGRPTGIIRDTLRSANGIAQTMNYQASKLKRKRRRVGV